MDSFINLKKDILYTPDYPIAGSDFADISVAMNNHHDMLALLRIACANLAVDADTVIVRALGRPGNEQGLDAKALAALLASHPCIAPAAAVECYNKAGNLFMHEGLVKSAANAFGEAGKTAFASNDADLWIAGKRSYADTMQLHRDLTDYSLASFTAGNYADSLCEKKMYREAIEAYETAIEWASRDNLSVLRGTQFLHKIERARRELQREKCNDVD